MEHRFEHQQSAEHSVESRTRGEQEQEMRRDFDQPEDLLRADRARVEPPGSLPERLAASGAAEGLGGGRSRPWWRRLLGG